MADAALAEERTGGASLALRVGWLTLVIGAVALGALSMPAYYHDLLTACSGASCLLDGALTAADFRALSAAGISAQAYGAYTLILYGAVTLVWLAVALLIFARRTNDTGALLIALILATANLVAINGPMTALALAHPALTWPINVLATLSDVTYMLLFLLFPNGRFVPRWTRWVVALQLVLSALTIMSPLDSPVNAPNSPIAQALGILPLGFFVIIIFAQVYRYRRVSTQRQREQSKWAVLGLVVAAVGVIGLNIADLIIAQAPGGGQPSAIIMNTLYPLVLLTVPVSIGAAILRYRLYDIDIIIKRTLVYGSLTAILAALYFALVIGAQTLTKLITGQQVGQQPAVIVLTTLVVAALFQPLRMRLQRTIDRRFDRSRYDAAKTVAAFSATLRSEVDLAQLNAQLLRVVEETMRPTHASLWLRSDNQYHQP